MTTSNPIPPQQPANNPQMVYVQAPKPPWYKRVGCIISLVIVLLFVLGLASCVAIFGGAAHEVDKSIKESDAEHTVTYRVEGDVQDGHVTYNVGEAQTTSDSGISSGWEKEAKVKGFFGAHMSVSNGINDQGTVTCKIIVDGKVVNENTANGTVAMATCSVSGDDLKQK